MAHIFRRPEKRRIRGPQLKLEAIRAIVIASAVSQKKKTSNARDVERIEL
jgi:hypothetical protein